MPNEQDKAWLAYGRDIEGAIANYYTYQTGNEVLDRGATTIAYHRYYPWIGATLDRVRKEGGEPVELKSILRFVTPAVWLENVPLDIQIQLQIQMDCIGSARGTVAALFPGPTLVHRQFDRDDNFLKAAYPIIDRFWHENVLKRVPPPADESKGALECVKRLYAKDNGETIKLSHNTKIDVREWRDLKALRLNTEKEIKKLETRIRDEMKDATFGKLDYGEMLTLKTTKRKAYTKEIKAGEHRTIRITKEE